MLPKNKFFRVRKETFTVTTWSRSTSDGSSVDMAFFFIVLLSLPPKSRSENPDLPTTILEPDRHDIAADFAKVKYRFKP